MRQKFHPVPWQRNLRKIPDRIAAKLTQDPNRDFVVGVVKAFPLTALERGLLSHLGIGVVNDEIVCAQRSLPRDRMGPYSKRNREGWEVKRLDLPMVTRTFSFETPNYGDWSNGSHTVLVDREVYQRDYFDPPEVEIVPEKLRAGAGEVVFKFVVDLPLNRPARDFNEDLLFALNVLQENVGSVDLIPRDAKADELLSTLTLDWEIFPPGTVDEVVHRAVKAMGRPTPEQETLVRERVKLFSSLKPKRYIQGRGGMNRYIGALFADDLVVFENIRYGNAMYVLYENWVEVSKRSRIDLLKARDVPFDRFVHSDDWAERFKAHIQAEKRRRGIKDDAASSHDLALDRSA